METQRFFATIVIPGLEFTEKWTGVPYDTRAMVGITAIAGQETDWKYRRQVGVGGYYPQTIGARGWWQFERMGAVNGLMIHAVAGPLVRKVCEALDIPFDVWALYEAIAWNDKFACAMARLLLWVDPKPLPGIEDNDREAWWQYYLRGWRPGAPRPADWPHNFSVAQKLVRELRQAPPATA